jgi:hypothetical protein
MNGDQVSIGHPKSGYSGLGFTGIRVNVTWQIWKNINTELIMNALEIIEEIKRLPDEERGRVIEFVREIPNNETMEAMEEAKNPKKLEGFDSATDMFEKLGIQC